MVEGRNVMKGVVAAVAAVIGITTAASRNADGVITSAGSVEAFEVRVGDCFDDEAFASTQISEVPGVPCTQPHDNEVYAAFDIAGDKWPGDERVEELAFDGCYDRFAGAIGKSYEESVYDYTAIYPSEGSWTRVQDREVLCVGYDVNFEQLTGSILGSGL
jgi:hypothetical protein